LLNDPTVPLWITEGQKKADVLVSQSLCAIALLRVWNWKSKNDLGSTTFAADWDYIALQGREIRIVFDSDVMTKASVQAALQRLIEHLQRKGATVKVAYLPTEGGHKLGVDDWLAQGHTADDLEGLLEGPRPAPQAAKPQVEILDEPPASMGRPLVLIDGKAYAATWLYVRKTITEIEDKNGQITRLREPKVVTCQELFVVREDGTIFGPGGDHPLEELALLVHLPEIPPPGKLWSKNGVMRYRAARKQGVANMVADPIDVFQRVVDVVESFVDFNRSLADQRTMAEMVGCYVLATWMLDAFHVIGFLWPNGDRGSGKTQLISLIAELAYLGQLILAGGSFAALRDLADYGALLAFDDAENLSDPKKTDPDKRALLLAGNRKGVTIPLKEPDGERRWKTRHVNAFCPRIFSAIHIPDPVLASRTIVVPLVRTADRGKGNFSPSDYSQWPHDRNTLIDDLWAVALGHLAELPAYEAKAKQAAHLTGRDLEPWLAMLSVASWLDAQDEQGKLTRCILPPGANEPEGEQDTSLFERLEALSVAYQGEREDLETSDTTGLLLQALCHCAIVPLGPCGPLKSDTGVFTVTTSEVTEAFETVAEEEEADISWMGERAGCSRRIGKLLARLRFARAPRPGGVGSRRWRVELEDLYHRMIAYGLEVPSELLRLIPTNGPNGPHGTMAQGDGKETQETSANDMARLGSLDQALLQRLLELGPNAGPAEDGGYQEGQL
jgi:hypothetical protein